MFETFFANKEGHRSIDRDRHENLEDALHEWCGKIYDRYPGESAVIQDSISCGCAIWDGKATGALIEHLPDGLTPEQICEALLSAEGEG